MLHRFTRAQWSVLLIELFETYGDLFSDEFLVQTLLLASPYEQRLLLQHFVPHYVARRSATTGASRRAASVVCRGASLTARRA